MADLTVEQIKNRVSFSQRFLRNYKPIWKRNIEILDGKHYPDNYKEEDKIVINHIWSIINSLVADIYISNPYIAVNSTKDVPAKVSEIYETLINYTFRQIKFKQEIRKIIKDVFVFGFGCMKFGYTPQGIFNYNENIIEDNIFAIRINPYDLIIDPEATDFENAKWLGHKYYLPYDDVMEDDYYENTQDIKPSISGSYYTDKELEGLDEKAITSDVKRVCLYEVWDKRLARYYIIADGYDKFLKNEKFPYLACGVPFRFLEFDVHQTKLFSVPFVQQIFPMNEEINKTRTQQMIHRSKAQPKILVEEGSMTIQEINKFKKSPDLAIIRMKKLGGLQQFIPPALPSDVYAVSQAMEEDLRNISGVSEVRMGGVTGFRTATEALMSKEGQQSISGDRVRTVEDFIGEIATKMLGIMKEYYTKEKVSDIIGEKVNWKFTNRQILSDENVVVEAGTSTPFNQPNRQQLAQVIMQMVGAIPNIDVKALFKFMARAMNIKNADELASELIPERQQQTEIPQPTQNDIAELLNAVKTGQIPPDQLQALIQSGQLPPEVLNEIQNILGAK